MRITSNMITKNYLSNLNTSLNTLNKLSKRVSTQREFSKASEDTARALKAFQVRRNLTRIDFYKENIEDAKSVFTNMESEISILNETLTEINVEVEKGINGTYSETNRKIIANVLKNMQSQILSVGNTRVNGKYLFGGSNVDNMPFEIDGAGNLLYNGLDVNSAAFPKDEVFIDAGMGFDVDASGNVDANTALNISYPGIELLGYGIDSDGLPNNLYNLVGEVITKFENNDMTDINKYFAKLSSRQDDVIVQLATVGEKTAFADFMVSRLENNEYNSLEKQTKLEYVDLAQAVMEYNNQKLCYDSALMLGSYILQKSLMDYLV